MLDPERFADPNTRLGFSERLRTLWEYQRADPLRIVMGGDASHLFKCLRIDGGHRVFRGVGDVDRLAVGRETEPLDSSPSTNMPEQFEVRKRVDENRPGDRAINPKSLAVRRYADAVRGTANLAPGLVPPRFVGEFNSRHLLMRRKIYHHEPVKAGEL